MKTKIFWLVLSCVVALSLVLASCAPAPKTPTPTPAPIPTPTPAPTPAPTLAPVAAPEVPSYGGTFMDAFLQAHTSFDDQDTIGTMTYTLHMTNECLQIGDWTKGPAGTNEYSHWLMTYAPKFEVANLAESWEVPDPSTVIFHIRKGIHYALNPQSEASRLVNGREMTAQDVAYCIQRKFAPSAYFGLNNPGWLQSVTATDKWTVVLKGDDSKQRTSTILEYTGQSVYIYPPEVVAKYGNMRDWSVSCGTGAFFFVDYVPGSSYTFVRNPNYWGKDPVGSGKGNQLPYVDGVKWLLILDKSTRVAALRTNKIDHLGGVREDFNWEDKESLLKTNPQLKWKGEIRPKTWCIFGRTDKPELPFKDIRVRKALQMAIDVKKIKDEYYRGQAEIIAFPISPILKDAYTPLEELPESTRELFSYNPKKAKELLAEAGYPNGFKTTVLCTDVFLDMLSIVTDYWAKIGVDAAIDLKERTVYLSIQQSRNHKEMIIFDTTPCNYKMVDTDPNVHNNLAMLNDPYINATKAQMWAFENMGKQAKRDQLYKEYALYVLSQAYAIQTPTPYVYNFWHPWVKNYHGENNIGYGTEPNWVWYAWLDRDLKKQMTGR